MRWNQPVCHGDYCVIIPYSDNKFYTTMVILHKNEIEWLEEHDIPIRYRTITGIEVVGAINLPKELAIEFYMRFS